MIYLIVCDTIWRCPSIFVNISMYKLILCPLIRRQVNEYLASFRDGMWSAHRILAICSLTEITAKIRSYPITSRYWIITGHIRWPKIPPPPRIEPATLVWSPVGEDSSANVWHHLKEYRWLLICNFVLKTQQRLVDWIYWPHLIH